MKEVISRGSPDMVIDDLELHRHLDFLLEKLAKNARSLLLIPPDATRPYSRADSITRYLYLKASGSMDVRILPAGGTHSPMDEEDCRRFFGREIPFNRFLAHRWREDSRFLGRLGEDRMSDWSKGRLALPVDVSVHRELFEGHYDLILSIGQVLPHEVVGMANYTKNILVGTGGPDMIHKSHYLGALCGIEYIMGLADNPVRRMLNETYDRFIRGRIPICFILTVVETEKEKSILRGLFCGEGEETFEAACHLSSQVNITRIDRPVQKMITYLDPRYYKSTWLGNKAIYRSRRAIARGGELVILAPGVRSFGEDLSMNRLIRRYGYLGTPEINACVKRGEDLVDNLAAAAHLIHGSSEGRFTITYCTEKLGAEEIEAVGYNHHPYRKMIEQYPPKILRPGFNYLNGEEIFYIAHPGAGLWVHDSESP